MKSVILGVIAFIAAGVVAPPALAVSMRAVITGTANSGWFDDARFGAGEATGRLDFELRLFYDPSLPGVNRITVDKGESYTSPGGYFLDGPRDFAAGSRSPYTDVYGTASPITRAELRIGGKVFTVAPDRGLITIGGANRVNSEFNMQTSDNDMSLSVQAFLPPFDTSRRPSLERRFSSFVVNPDARGVFWSRDNSIRTDDVDLRQIYTDRVAPVPLPPALLLAGSGFAALGALRLRRRRSAPAAPAPAA